MDFDLDKFEQYVKDTCFDLSPPDDPGCACHLPKGHEGQHHCGGCDTVWDDWEGPLDEYYGT